MLVLVEENCGIINNSNLKFLFDSNITWEICKKVQVYANDDLDADKIVFTVLISNRLSGVVRKSSGL